MMTMGKLKTVTMIAVISLGVTAAAPVRAADAEDILGVIVGLAAIAAIADKLDDDDDRGSAHRTYRGDRNTRYYDQRRSWRWVLPEDCLRRVETRRGDRTVLGRRCLERNGVHTARLPDRCEWRIDTRRGPRTVYGARCLRKAGYEIGHRHSRRR